MSRGPVSNLFLIPDDPDPSWRERAACRGKDPSLFVPSSFNRRQDLSKAARICAGCPVQTECRSYAERNPDIVGLWGGDLRPLKARRGVKRLVG